ncbi:MAG TPA: adenylate/guanylate cyclase domain-containing protein, partial [Candidatus Peregrinibacteria bacterium]|nr:adenylate/guanylate cyclase domain-containing protein [Candidatus Peregrinibacteria bacterium]
MPLSEDSEEKKKGKNLEEMPIDEAPKKGEEHNLPKKKGKPKEKAKKTPEGISAETRGAVGGNLSRHHDLRTMALKPLDLKEKLRELKPLICRIAYLLRDEKVPGKDIDGSGFFLDVAGFTSRCEEILRECTQSGERDRGGEMVTDIIRKLWSAIEQIIYDHKGYIDKYSGDAVTVFFLEKNHAQRAARCAQKIQEKVSQMRKEKIGITIGIHTGKFGFALLGDDSGRRFGVVGGEAKKMKAAEKKAGEISQGTTVVTAKTFQCIQSQAPSYRKITSPEGTLYELIGSFNFEGETPERILPPDDDVLSELKFSRSFASHKHYQAIEAKENINNLGTTVTTFLNFVNINEIEETLGEGRRNLFFEIWDVVFREINTIATQYGGIVDKFDEENIMIVFGFPNYNKKDADRAAACILQVAENLPKVVQKIFPDAPLLLKSGTTQGETRNGEFGSKERYDITPIGDPVNTAARIMAGARTGEHLLHTNTCKAISSQAGFATEERNIVGKGKKKRIPCRAILEIKAEAKKEFENELIGREKEFREALEIIQSTETSTLLISSEDGGGKSHFLHEVLKKLRDEKITSHRTECTTHERGTAYAAFRPFLQSLLQPKTDQSINMQQQTVGTLHCNAPTEQTSGENKCGDNQNENDKGDDVVGTRHGAFLQNKNTKTADTSPRHLLHEALKKIDEQNFISLLGPIFDLDIPEDPEITALGPAYCKERTFQIILSLLENKAGALHPFSMGRNGRSAVPTKTEPNAPTSRLTLVFDSIEEMDGLSMELCHYLTKKSKKIKLILVGESPSPHYEKLKKEEKAGTVTIGPL